VSWSGEFEAALKASNLQPRYLLESVAAPGFHPLGGWLTVSSHNVGQGYDQILASQGHRVSAGTLTPRDWRCTLAQATVRLIKLPQFLPARGQLVQLRMGFPGWSISQYQPLITGHLQGLQRDADGGYTATIRSVLGALSRQTTITAQGSLFYALPVDPTTLAATYTAGDATITVASSTGSARETGEEYMIEVTPDSGDPFLVTASALAANVYTVATAGVLGTSDASAASGNAVRILAYVADHPVNVARKVLLSGTLGNFGDANYTTLPSSWGVGLPDEVVDHVDCDETISSDPSTAALAWNVHSATPQDDVYGWLSSVLSPGGYFLADHHGQVSVRAGRSPTDHSYEEGLVYDRDVVAVVSHQLWDPGQAVEYGQITVASANLTEATTSETLITRPAAADARYELPFVGTNPSTWRQRIRDRLGPWVLRVAEIVELDLLGWRHAGLAPGSGLALRTRYVQGRMSGDPPWFVLQCEPDWFGASTRVVAARVSDQTDE